MAIEIKRTGGAAAAGISAGISKALGYQLDEKQALEAESRAKDWEQEKMAMRSQQDFQQELTAKQWEFEKFNRAKSWNIEKMEMISRMDFERDEKERSRKIDVFNNGVEAIKKYDFASENQKNQALYNLASKNTDLEEAAPYLGLKPKEQKLPSARSQVSEIEAGFELEGYTPDDLRELGLDPVDFPGIREEIQYELEQIISTPQGDMKIVGFDEDGEPLVEPVAKQREYGATGSW